MNCTLTWLRKLLGLLISSCPRLPRNTLFGEGSDDDESKIVYLQHFESERMNNLGKISGLGVSSSNHIQIHFDSKLPILFRTNVGTLGKINVYVKSKEQTENDNEEKLNN